MVLQLRLFTASRPQLSKLSGVSVRAIKALRASLLRRSVGSAYWPGYTAS